MGAKDVVFSPAGAILPARRADLPTWRQRVRGARNILSLVRLASVFTWRSAVSWRRWRRRHPDR
jgi:hypothetical protein